MCFSLVKWRRVRHTLNPMSQSRTSRTTPKSNQLESTLKELESAFHTWDNLGAERKKSGKNKIAQTQAAQALAAKAESEEELKRKTKKLLSQLRKQIKDLSLD